MSTVPPQEPGFFSWLVPALKTRRTVKTWIRCCLVLAAAMILLIDNVTLQNLGQAAFFTAIVAVMLPPSLAFSLFLMAVVTLLFGMLLGWAWAAATMAAGFSVRSQALLVQQGKLAQASLVPGIPATLQFQKFIFQGMFLDPRTTGVYAVFLFIGTFALGALRAYVPKLTLTSIFGCIVLDVMSTYGPLFPTSQYTLPKMFILPTAYYTAIALASLVLIFPESLNHVWLTTLCNDFLAPISKTLAIQSAALASTPSDHASWAALTEEGSASRQGLVAAAQGLLGQIAMVDLEISVGRLGPGDLKKISGELQSLMFRASSLHAFQTFVNYSNEFLQQEQEQLELELAQGKQESISSSTSSDPQPQSKPKVASTSKPNPITKRTPNRFTYHQRRTREREAQHGHDFDTLVPILASSSQALRDACEGTLSAMDTWFRECNSGRWSGFFFGGSAKEKKAREEASKKLVEVTEVLKKVLGQWRETDRVELVKPYERFFDKETRRLKEKVMKDKVAEMFAARSLFICFVFSYSLDSFAERLLHLLDILIELDVKRPRPRVWVPSGFGKLGRKIMSRMQVDASVTPLAMGTNQDPTNFDGITETDDDDDDVTVDHEAENGAKAEKEDEEEGVEEPLLWHARNPDATPPTTALGRSVVKFGAIFRFLKSPEGIFSLRTAVVSIAMWVPAVCHSTAWFYYENRGLWALIMAQMGLAMYAGDQISGFVVRLVGTGIGLLIGMVAWYIGAGHGNGNPYGVVIATTVLVAPCYLGRLAAPPQQIMFWTMVGVTIVFVVGYSWLNTHFQLVSNLGVGVTIGWKRALLVIIGFTASFIVMLFPSPTSSRTLVRRTLAATLSELGHILAVEIEALLAEEARLKAGHYEKVEFVGLTGGKISPKEKRVRKIAQRFMVVATRLQALAPSLTTAKFDPQLQGIWPHEKYARLYKTQMKILSSLAVFTGAFAKLDTKWCSVLVLRTPFLNPNLLADVFSNLSILSYALAGGHPIPASLPNLRDRVIYHERLAAHVTFHSQPVASLDEPDEPVQPSDETHSEFDHESTFAAHKVDGSSIGFEEMTLDVLMDEQLPAHSTALIALSNVITLVDEMATIVRDLCGEKSFRGYDVLQRDFLGREEQAIGGGFFEKDR